MRGYFHAETEDGARYDDVSGDFLFALIDDLYHPDNTFVILEPDDESQDWFASVTLQDNGTYEMEWRDMPRHDHELAVETDRGHITEALMRWLAARHYPGKPVRDSASGGGDLRWSDREN